MGLLRRNSSRKDEQQPQQQGSPKAVGDASMPGGAGGMEPATPLHSGASDIDVTLSPLSVLPPDTLHGASAFSPCDPIRDASIWQDKLHPMPPASFSSGGVLGEYMPELESPALTPRSVSMLSAPQVLPPQQLSSRLASGHAGPLMSDSAGASAWRVTAAQQQHQQQQQAGSLFASSNGMHAPLPQPLLQHDARYFEAMLRQAATSQDSLDRFSAITFLVHACREQIGQLPATCRPPQRAWAESEAGRRVLRHILATGRVLASFCTAEFETKYNSTRAIMAGDVQALLSEYVRSFGRMLDPQENHLLPAEEQVNALTVYKLLLTRCTAFNMIYDQLINRVGLEQRGTGGASMTVINAPSVSAAPITTISANPNNSITASSSSKSKALIKDAGWVIGLVAVAGVVLVKLLRGGGGGSGGRQGGSDAGGSGKKSPRKKRGSSYERDLVAHAVQCGRALKQSLHNDALLQDDWRLGKLRLAWPPAANPQGYEQVDLDACDLSRVLGARL